MTSKYKSSLHYLYNRDNFYPANHYK